MAITHFSEDQLTEATFNNPQQGKVLVKGPVFIDQKYFNASHNPFKVVNDKDGVINWRKLPAQAIEILIANGLVYDKGNQVTEEYITKALAEDPRYKNSSRSDFIISLASDKSVFTIGAFPALHVLSPVLKRLKIEKLLGTQRLVFAFDDDMRDAAVGPVDKAIAAPLDFPHFTKTLANKVSQHTYFYLASVIEKVDYFARLQNIFLALDAKIMQIMAKAGKQTANQSLYFDLFKAYFDHVSFSAKYSAIARSEVSYDVTEPEPDKRSSYKQKVQQALEKIDNNQEILSEFKEIVDSTLELMTNLTSEIGADSIFFRIFVKTKDRFAQIFAATEGFKEHVDKVAVFTRLVEHQFYLHVYQYYQSENMPKEQEDADPSVLQLFAQKITDLEKEIASLCEKASEAMPDVLTAFNDDQVQTQVKAAACCPKPPVKGIAAIFSTENTNASKRFLTDIYDKHFDPDQDKPAHWVLEDDMHTYEPAAKETGGFIYAPMETLARRVFTAKLTQNANGEQATTQIALNDFIVPSLLTKDLQLMLHFQPPLVVLAALAVSRPQQALSTDQAALVNFVNHGLLEEKLFVDMKTLVSEQNLQSVCALMLKDISHTELNDAEAKNRLLASICNLISFNLVAANNNIMRLLKEAERAVPECSAVFLLAHMATTLLTHAQALGQELSQANSEKVAAVIKDLQGVGITRNMPLLQQAYGEEQCAQRYFSGIYIFPVTRKIEQKTLAWSTIVLPLLAEINQGGYEQNSILANRLAIYFIHHAAKHLADFSDGTFNELKERAQEDSQSSVSVFASYLSGVVVALALDSETLADLQCASLEQIAQSLQLISYQDVEAPEQLPIDNMRYNHLRTMLNATKLRNWLNPLVANEQPQQREMQWAYDANIEKHYLPANTEHDVEQSMIGQSQTGVKPLAGCAHFKQKCAQTATSSTYHIFALQDSEQNVVFRSKNEGVSRKVDLAINTEPLVQYEISYNTDEQQLTIKGELGYSAAEKHLWQPEKLVLLEDNIHLADGTQAVAVADVSAAVAARANDVTQESTVQQYAQWLAMQLLKYLRGANNIDLFEALDIARVLAYLNQEPVQKALKTYEKLPYDMQSKQVLDTAGSSFKNTSQSFGWIYKLLVGMLLTMTAWSAFNNYSDVNGEAFAAIYSEQVFDFFIDYVLPVSFTDLLATYRDYAFLLLFALATPVKDAFSNWFTRGASRASHIHTLVKEQPHLDNFMLFAQVLKGTGFSTFNALSNVFTTLSENVLASPSTSFAQFKSASARSGVKTAPYTPTEKAIINMTYAVKMGLSFVPLLALVPILKGIQEANSNLLKKVSDDVVESVMESSALRGGRFGLNFFIGCIAPVLYWANTSDTFVVETWRWLTGNRSTSYVATNIDVRQNTTSSFWAQSSEQRPSQTFNLHDIVVDQQTDDQSGSLRAPLLSPRKGSSA